MNSKSRISVGLLLLLVAVLAIVLMGKGVAALQKIGYLEITPITMPRIDVLGVYPSMQTILAQVLTLMIIVASVVYNIQSQRKSSAKADDAMMER